MTTHTAAEFRVGTDAKTRASRSAGVSSAFSELRKTIWNSSPEEIARRAGAVWDPDTGDLYLELLGLPYSVTWRDLRAYLVGHDTPVPNQILGIFLYYLSLADGISPSNEWISFRELPDGWLYHAAFQGYTGNVLASAVADDVSALERAAIATGGQPLDLGDAAFSFTALPNVYVAVVYWLGDDEFDADAQVLFDAAASHYLTTDGLAVLGSHLVRRLQEKL